CAKRDQCGIVVW
nr:immunoglobulin heavy chain junction region [Macaca mulatta]